MAQSACKELTEILKDILQSDEDALKAKEALAKVQKAVSLLSYKHVTTGEEKRILKESGIELYVDVFLKFRIWRDTAKDADKDRYIEKAYDLLLSIFFKCASAWAEVCNRAHQLQVVVYLFHDLRSEFYLSQISSSSLLNKNVIYALGAIGVLPEQCYSIAETIKIHGGKQILERYFKSKRRTIQLLACFAYIWVTSTSPNSLTLPTFADDCLISALLGTLAGADEAGLTAALLLRNIGDLLDACGGGGQQLIAKGLLDVLRAVLEAPLAEDDESLQNYVHEKSTKGNLVDYSTNEEKALAIQIIWSLVLTSAGEQNAKKINVHPIKETLENCEIEKFKEEIDGILWQLEHAAEKDSDDNSPKAPIQSTSHGDEKTAVNVQEPVAKPASPATSAALNRAKLEPNRLPSSATKASKPPLEPSAAAYEGPKKTQNVNQVKKQVMISYASKYKPKFVMKLNEALKKAGISTWIYVSNMRGDMYEAMAKAIEESAVVLICYSQPYYDSKPCHAELNYANELKRSVIPVRLEKFSPRGWLGIAISGKRYVDFASAYSEDQDKIADENMFNQSLQQLILEIQQGFDDFDALNETSDKASSSDAREA